MTGAQIGIIRFLLIASLAFIVVPIIVYIVRDITSRLSDGSGRNLGVSKMLKFTACLLGSIWCLRYAVGFYAIVVGNDGAPTLTWGEEIFNSIVHTLQTFSMDEDYTEYIIDGKDMLRAVAGGSGTWQDVYGIYASVLNFIAPVVGGAIIFEILASIFPKVRLWLLSFAVWRKKYYFSELNEASVALATSVCRANKGLWRRPIIIFTDSYVNAQEEGDSEMLLEAKSLGAICVKDDLSHIVKARHGERSFFLMDQAPVGNIQSLTTLSDNQNCKYLKNAEIYMFMTNDAYVQVEQNVRNRLKNDMKFENGELPVFIPVNSYRNLISNMLVDIPLYEPLINKVTVGKTVDLVLTILGVGDIGTEMFLSSYWFGQMLNCRLTINIVSNELEDTFWNRIDYINPEIRRTTMENDSILEYNSRKDQSPVYCKVNYVYCDINSSEFVKRLNPGEGSLLDTDYFFVALGSDKENLSAASTLRRYVGKYHLSEGCNRQTVITYVVYNPELSEILNRTKYYFYSSDGYKNSVGDTEADVYMCAVGSLHEVYGARNVFMTDHEDNAQAIDLRRRSESEDRQTFEAVSDYEKKRHGTKASTEREQRRIRAAVHSKRMNDDYQHWANLARTMHRKYKLFSMGLLTGCSIFDEARSPQYEVAAVKEAYKVIYEGGKNHENAAEHDKWLRLMHSMSWLEHRRWCAFTRVKGFQGTDKYSLYIEKEESHRQMDLRLHPCLVECGKQGIRAKIKDDGTIDDNAIIEYPDKTPLDRLDELSDHVKPIIIEIKQRQKDDKGSKDDPKPNDLDFKVSDYPFNDFKL